MTKYPLSIACIVFSFLSFSLSAEPSGCIKGKVTYVDDGDTANMRTLDGQNMKIRFYGIDSPEKKWPNKWPAQPFSAQAKRYAQKLILDKEVCVRLTGNRTYKRLEGEIFIGDKSVSDAMVFAGLAWWSSKHAPHDVDLKSHQRDAFKNKRGLWSQPNPEAPWDFRRRYR